MKCSAVSKKWDAPLAQAKTSQPALRGRDILQRKLGPLIHARLRIEFAHLNPLPPKKSAYFLNAAKTFCARGLSLSSAGLARTAASCLAISAKLCASTWSQT